MKGMQIRQTKHRRAGNELLVRTMFSPVLQTSLSVTGIDACRHISCVTPDRVWVSDDDKLVLTDTTTGDNLYAVKDSWHSDGGSGVHTVNNDFELIYINKDKDINKLSKDMKNTITFIRNTDSKWNILSLYFSASTRDLLVGMFTVGEPSKINVYSNTGCLTRTVSQMYSWPRYITKNNNGDVVVSDSGSRAVIVTSGQGSHRFSYRGKGFQLWPRGICTDAMSHILVCDEYTKTVQMIDKDGDFLSYLLTYRSPGRSGLAPIGLSYDVNNHILFVGQWGTNKVFIYKSDNRYLALNDKPDLCDVVLSSDPSKSRCIPGLTQEEYSLFSVKAEAKFALETATWAAANIQTAALKATATTTRTAKKLARIMAKSILPKVANEMAGLKSSVEAAEATLQEYENAASEVEAILMFPKKCVCSRTQLALMKVANEMANIKAAVEAAEAALKEEENAASEVEEILMFPKKCAHSRAHLSATKIPNEMARIKAAVEAAEVALQEYKNAASESTALLTFPKKYECSRAQLAASKVANEMTRIKAAVVAAEATLQEYENTASELTSLLMFPKKYECSRAQLAASKVAYEMTRIKAVAEAAEATLQEYENAASELTVLFMLSEVSECRRAQLAASKVTNEMSRIKAAMEAAEVALQEYRNAASELTALLMFPKKYECSKAQLAASKVANEMTTIKAAVEAAEVALQEYENAASELTALLMFPKTYECRRAQLAASKVANKMARIKAAVEAAKPTLQEYKNAVSDVERKCALNRAQLAAPKVANKMARIKAAAEAAEATTILAEAKASAKHATEALFKIEELLEEVKEDKGGKRRRSSSRY